MILAMESPMLHNLKNYVITTQQATTLMVIFKRSRLIVSGVINLWTNSAVVNIHLYVSVHFFYQFRLFRCMKFFPDCCVVSDVNVYTI